MSMPVLSHSKNHFRKKSFSYGKIAIAAIFVLAAFAVLTGQASADNAAESEVEKPLTNSNVIAMVKAGLGDDIVIAKINQAPAEELDVSTDALLNLKKRGLSKAVIESMIKRVDKRTRNLPVVQTESQPPTAKDGSNVKSSGEPACLANFVTEGGFLLGETKRSFQEYPELRNWDAVFDNLLRSVTTGGWQILGSNKEAGTISGAANVRNIVEDVRQFFGGEVAKLILNVSLKMRESGGMRVETVLLVPARTKLPDDDAKSVFCRILGSVAR